MFVFRQERVTAFVVLDRTDLYHLSFIIVLDYKFLSGKCHFFLIVKDVFLSEKSRITIHVLIRSYELSITSLEVRLLISGRLTYNILMDLDN